MACVINDLVNDFIPDDEDLLTIFIVHKLHNEFNLPWLLSFRVAFNIPSLDQVGNLDLSKLKNIWDQRVFEKHSTRYVRLVRDALDSVDPEKSVKENYLLSLVITEFTKRLDAVAG